MRIPWDFNAKFGANFSRASHAPNYVRFRMDFALNFHKGCHIQVDIYRILLKTN